MEMGQGTQKKKVSVFSFYPQEIEDLRPWLLGHCAVHIEANAKCKLGSLNLEMGSR